MYGLDLFSGIGGITKALEGYVVPVAYCELDTYARAVLLSRMGTGDLPVAPIWGDVTTLRAENIPQVEIIYGGFPCQDISVAGRGEGLAGERSGLFFQIVRLVKEIKPSFVFLENVPNIRTKGLGRVLKELDSVGYDCRWGLLSAADVGANHKRERWFLLAHSSSVERPTRTEEQGIVREMSGDGAKRDNARGSSSPLAGAQGAGLQSTSNGRGQSTRSGEMQGLSVEPTSSGEDVAHSNSQSEQRLSRRERGTAWH